MRVLIIEDDRLLLVQLKQGLERELFTVDVAATGEDGAHLGAEESYDAIILDLGLPDMDGLDILRQWRAADRNTPVLILTARGDWHAKLIGLNAGADDYLAKPFEIAEVAARLRALIRRAHGQASSILRHGRLELDLAAAEARRDGQAIRLTAHEFKTLAYMMRHAGSIVSQAELTEALYAQDFVRDSNTIEVFIARLRRKLGADAIETVRGLGYRLGSS
ncbi:response regulator [Methylocella tundrae]|uniref:Transcriptional regulatory protein QseB n=1 Tax=Methylocella tundrae TaxID=227605 RepID=A0A4U8Z6H0_METTU|nr:response regulator transcription factor [Methylocella tundrae]WPP03054.1 response regulator transcription factor [Methylocella tundrae]VFU16309.1 Transcriptional regulatory protein QseB [Methylocella tundrae]